MIPLRYRLRPAVRMEAAADGDWLVVSGVPLSALRVNVAAARLLERLRGGATVDALAAGLSLTPERCLELCETFRRRGLLEVEPAEDAHAPLPAVTVVVPTRDRADALGECLRAVSRLDYPRELLDVIVVDDGSDDPTAVERVAVTHGARVLAQATNLGPAAARNRAAAEATGEVLTVDRYRPSEQMRRMLRARDRHCRFPGCRVPASRCDIDHTLDAQYGGATATDNLAHLCRGHHTLKHHTGWRVEQRTGGVLEWTSPTGRTRQTGPPGRVRFVPAAAPF